MYGEIASLVFIRFRSISDLRDESGKFLPGFRTFLSRQPKESTMMFIAMFSKLFKTAGQKQYECRETL